MSDPGIAASGTVFWVTIWVSGVYGIALLYVLVNVSENREYMWTHDQRR